MPTKAEWWQGRGMKSVNYGTETFRTSDAIADALMSYTATLRGIDRGVLVTVPIVGDEGADSISLVLSPGIPMSSRPSVSEIPDPESVEILDQLSEATLRRTGATVVVPGDVGPEVPGYDDELTTGKE